MICKFCNAQIDEEHKFCPYCGKSQEEVLEQAVETIPEENEEICEIAPAPKKGKAWKIALAISGGVVALGALAVLLLSAFGVKLIPENDVHIKDKYTADKLKADTVVAKIGDDELTNSVLQVYYMTAVDSFAQYYSAYMDYIGLDVEADLGQQACYFDKEMTWEQYFIEEALAQWQNLNAICKVAEKEGFTLDEEWSAALQTMPEELEKSATEGGYDSALAMLQYIYGNNCTVDSYLEYANDYYFANAYNASYYKITDDDLEAYFTKNEAAFAEEGITRDSGVAGTVRHILITPEGGTTDDTGATTYSEDEWNNCLNKAETVLNEWKSGEATEESFAKLVTTYSADSGSTGNGGLYEDIVADGTYVEEFEAWAVDAARQAGDVEIVKTTFGYHIMYYVSGEPEWRIYADTSLSEELYNNLQAAVEAKMEEVPMEVNYKKIVLG